MQQSIDSNSSATDDRKLPQSSLESSNYVLPRARLGLALKLSVRQIWDHLGITIGISLVGILLAAVPLSIGIISPASVPLPVRVCSVLIVGTLLLSAFVAGVFHVAHLICSHDEVTPGEFWRSAIRLARPAITLGLIHLLVATGFAANLYFYLHMGRIGLAAELLCLYLLLFWGMMAVLHFPLLAAQEAGVFDEPERKARRGAFAVLRRAFYLVLGNPLYSLGLLISALLFTVLLLITRVLFALLWLGGIAILTVQGARLLLIQFGIVPPPPSDDEIVPDSKFRIKA